MIFLAFLVESMCPVRSAWQSTAVIPELRQLRQEGSGGLSPRPDWTGLHSEFHASLSHMVRLSGNQTPNYEALPEGLGFYRSSGTLGRLEWETKALAFKGVGTLT